MSFDSPQPPVPPHAPAGTTAAPAPQPEKPKKPLLKRWWFWAIAIVVAIAIFAPKGGGDTTASEQPAAEVPAADTASEAPAEEEPATEEPAEEAPALAPIGTAAQTGNLAITVTKVEPGVAQVGEEVAGTLFGEKAQGQFVLVHVSVENVGTEAESFSDMNAKVYDAEGREFEANSAAGIYIDGNDSLFGEINPGNTLQGVLVFDLPADATAERLEYKGMLDFLADPAVFALT
ncbi:DUF4352 domain-containing protein [Microbacterium lacusdiani]|jgi:hypothetical protein